MRKMLGFSFVAGALLVVGVAAHHSVPTDLPQELPPTEVTGVGALGRIEPHSYVLQVNAPSIMDPPVVEELKVSVGQKVEKSHILAVLDSNCRKQADLELAKAELVLAEKSLAKVLAGAKQGDIRAQESLIERVRERLRLAEIQLDRVQRLMRSNATTQDQTDESISGVEVLKRELRQEEATLEALLEVRTVDVEQAQAEVDRAKAVIERKEADLEVSLVRSPIAGEILRINYRDGERIGTDGLLDLGDTRCMNVVAEIHESDILKVQLGQPASIFIRDLDRTLHGEVIEVGRIVGRKDVLSNDPVDDTDARVVEVRIRLNEADSQLVSGMSFARVEVSIDTAPQSSGRTTGESDDLTRKE